MSIELISFLFVAVFVVILLTGLPLAFATGAVAVFFAVVLFGWPGLTLIVGRVFTLMGNYVLVSVPLFIFMACVLERAGIAEAIFRAAHVWSGRMPGGLAVAVIISCALMAAMVGVIGAEIVTMGVVALPAMLARGYKKELALGCICAGGGLATLIPPSVVFIMYGLTAGVSIGQLYMAGVIPGLMLAAMYIAYIIVRCRQRPDFAPPASEAELAIPLRAKVALLKELILPGLVAFSVLGSLYLGWATPTEAAGVGVLGAVVAMWWNGKFGWDKLRKAAEDTAKVTVMLYWLFFGSSALIGVYTLAGGTKLIQDALAGLPVGPLGVVVLIQIVWIILGCFIDWIGILLLTAPIFVPVVLALGFDPVWMGVLFCMNMQISYISPPFGPAAFYLKGVTPAGITLGDIFGSIWPYMGLQVIALGLVVAFPQIALWLPNTMMK
ncbi:MAG: TRAP transporter large permease subunit [Betaproteobacteria bacterium]|nr:MAG: TRAP transporter large permease subunit [Betaproteobacteria bacterium]TMI11796.1 MAG: TRAP transporter large permease subunit [Betaproteobacteria bacterium]